MKKFNELTTKKARIHHIREMLGRNPKWAVAALLRIYERQTEEEQASQSTHVHNGVGFTGADAEILSSFAQQVQRGRTLSAKQMDLLNRRIRKYARQLESIAAEKETSTQ
jgi:hypothetical protein